MSMAALGAGSIFVEPDLRRNRITVHLAVAEPGEFRFAIDGMQDVTVVKAGSHLLSVSDYVPWTPDSPELYTLRCKHVIDGEAAEEASVRFGMREFTVKEGRFHLNGRPFYVRGIDVAFEVGRAGNGGPDRERVRGALAYWKAAGINLIRFSGAHVPEGAYDVCDELGLLVCRHREVSRGGDGAESWDAGSVTGEELDGDRNHPSLVIRSFVVGSGRTSVSMDGFPAPLVCARDPSRVVLLRRAWEGDGRGEALCWRPYRDASEPYEDLRLHSGTPMSRFHEEELNGVGEPGWLTFVSELGLGIFDDPGPGEFGEDGQAAGGFRARELDRVFGSIRELSAAARRMRIDTQAERIDQIRGNSKIAGYCLGNRRDGIGLFEPASGATTVEPILIPIQRCQEGLRPIIRMAQRNLVPRQEVPVSVVLVNEAKLEGRADLSLQVVSPTNQVLWKKKRSVKLPRPGKELWSGSISASGSPGAHRFVVRLMRTAEVIAENAMPFFVYNPAPSSDVKYHAVDPEKRWSAACAKLATPAGIRAPVHVIPPLADTIRAYPAQPLAQVIGQIKEGAVGLFFEPPEDWHEWAEIMDPELGDAVGGSTEDLADAVHYNKLHPVFDGLPAGNLMAHSYRNLIGRRIYEQMGTEDICGSFRAGARSGAGKAVWGSHILVRRYGSGLIVLIQLQVFRFLGSDPVAGRLFVNLLRHFSRRSAPSEGVLPVHPESAEWLRREQSERVRRWMIVGLFPNWDGAGFDREYPPERAVDLDGSEAGAYETVTWKSCHSTASSGELVDVGKGFYSPGTAVLGGDRGVGYVYGEFICDERGPSELELVPREPLKIWLNGKEVFSDPDPEPLNGGETRHVPVYFRQGKNRLLIKLVTRRGGGRFSTQFCIPTGGLVAQWWK